MSLSGKNVARMVLAASVVTSIALGQTQAPSSTVPAFTLSLIAPSEPFTLGEPIHLKMRMTNTTDHVVYVVRGPGESWGDMIVGVTMIDSKGLRVLSYKELKAMENGGRQPITGGSFVSDDIPPRQTIEREVRLERVLKITAPGYYTVRIGRGDYESKILVKSDPIEIDILPASMSSKDGGEK